ncbi:MAG: hypothetical protein ACFFG0_03840 [Candidatus Thorarchaeota archaeon]
MKNNCNGCRLINSTYQCGILKCRNLNGIVDLLICPCNECIVKTTCTQLCEPREYFYINTIFSQDMRIREKFTVRNWFKKEF